MRNRAPRIAVLRVASVAAALATSAVPGIAATPPAALDASVPSLFDHTAIHYRAVGKGAPAVVLVHCWMCDSGIWDNVVPELAQRYRVITLDLPGHGTSGKDRKVWSMAAYGEDVRTVVDTLRLDRVILVGHSMGGPVMLEAARVLRGKVVGMVAVDTLHDADVKSDPKEIDAWIAKVRADFPGQTKQLVHAIAGKASDPAAIDRIAEKMASGDPAIGLALMDSLLHYDIKAGMQAARAPMIAINSTMRPTNVAANRKALPSYELLPLPEGVGHFPQLEAPQAFNRLLAQAIASLAARR